MTYQIINLTERSDQVAVAFLQRKITDTGGFIQISFDWVNFMEDDCYRGRVIRLGREDHGGHALGKARKVFEGLTPRGVMELSEAQFHELEQRIAWWQPGQP